MAAASADEHLVDRGGRDAAPAARRQSPMRSRSSPAPAPPARPRSRSSSRWPASASAIRRRSRTSSDKPIQIVEQIDGRRRASLGRLPSRRHMSSVPRIAAIGVCSSCDASAAKRRAARHRRSRCDRASRSASSPADRARRCRRARRAARRGGCAWMSRTRATMESTGASARLDREAAAPAGDRQHEHDREAQQQRQLAERRSHDALRLGDLQNAAGPLPAAATSSVVRRKDGPFRSGIVRSPLCAARGGHRFTLARPGEVGKGRRSEDRHARRRRAPRSARLTARGSDGERLADVEAEQILPQRSSARRCARTCEIRVERLERRARAQQQQARRRTATAWCPGSAGTRR